MVSEDSQDIRWLPTIHGLNDFSNLYQSRNREVLALLDETQNPHEPVEVFTLRRSQLVLLKERDDDVPQISEPLHAVQGQLLPVVIVPLIHIDLAASEDADKFFQSITTRHRLCNHELWLHLPAKCRFVISEDGDTETAFPIDKTSYPSADPESFLLIVRTSHIVTAVHTATIQTSCISLERRVVEDSTEFPANSRLLIALSPMRGAAPLCLQRGIPTLGTLVTTQSLHTPDCRCVSHRAARSFLPGSPCRHGGRTVSSASIAFLQWELEFRQSWRLACSL